MQAGVKTVVVGLALASSFLAAEDLPGAFTATAAMVAARSQHTATLLTDGRVLITGGRGTTGTAVESAELYAPTTGLFSLTGSMTTPRYGHTATLLPDGKVLIAGGFNSSNTYPGLVSSELYDPASGTFTRA